MIEPRDECFMLHLVFLFLEPFPAATHNTYQVPDMIRTRTTGCRLMGTASLLLADTAAAAVAAAAAAAAAAAGMHVCISSSDRELKRAGRPLRKKTAGVTGTPL